MQTESNIKSKRFDGCHYQSLIRWRVEPMGETAERYPKESTFATVANIPERAAR